jgi:lysine N6-hydroxylase
MPKQKIYDIIGIGIGPFNLGLAALCFTIPELSCLFIDQNESFNWHEGIMIPGSRLQVPFYADLVTLANPCNPFSFMAFLKAKKRMFRFAIQENYFIKRTEYNEYCRWVADQLTSLQFNSACISIEKENQFYRVKTNNGIFLAQKIVLGTGTVPFVPELSQKENENIFHSANYLHHRDRITKEGSITIVGSGQSAAEIFYDLLQFFNGKLSWFTRSKRFFPMDYSKLTLEFSTPDYIAHFYSIPDTNKPKILSGQDSLYKGINHSLISDIYDLMVEKDRTNIQLYTNCELKKIGDDLSLTFLHTEMEKTFVHPTNVAILATGYQTILPTCLKPLRPLIKLDSQGKYKANLNYSIDENNSIYIQNAEQPTHGFNASDLSLGPYRNAVIINTILGYEHYHIEKNITFQTFGLPLNCQ